MECDGGMNFQLTGRNTIGEDSVLLCLCHGLSRGAEVTATKTAGEPIFMKLRRTISYVHGSAKRQRRFYQLATQLAPPGTTVM